MRYFEVTVKFGHVGKNKYYKGNIYLKAENGKEAASRARACPRVKHDHKDAILSVTELDYETFQKLWEQNENISYFSCYIMLFRFILSLILFFWTKTLIDETTNFNFITKQRTS